MLNKEERELLRFLLSREKGELRGEQIIHGEDNGDKINMIDKLLNKLLK